MLQQFISTKTVNLLDHLLPTPRKFQEGKNNYKNSIGN